MTLLNKKFSATVLACACTVAFAAATAHAESQSVQLAPSISVNYTPEDLESEKGVQNVYRKLRKAARRVCGIDGGFLNLSEKTLAQKCVDDTLASAVRKIDRPVLTALHDSSNGKVG
jgi:UrcA family protein